MDSNETVNRRRRGRPIGSTGQKRKAPEEYSVNQHTKKARARFEQLSTHEQNLERSKNAYKLALRRLDARLGNNEEYVNASPEDQGTIRARETAKLNQY
jgi:hypothetical protein